MAYRYKIVPIETGDLDINNIPAPAVENTGHFLRSQSAGVTNWSYSISCREILTSDLEYCHRQSWYVKNKTWFIVHYTGLRGEGQLALAQSVARGLTITNQYVYGKLKDFTREQVSLLLFILCKAKVYHEIKDYIKPILYSFLISHSHQYFYVAFAIWLINKGLESIVYRNDPWCNGVYSSLLSQTYINYNSNKNTTNSHHKFITLLFEFCREYKVNPSSVKTSGSKWQLNQYIGNEKEYYYE